MGASALLSGEGRLLADIDAGIARWVLFEPPGRRPFFSAGTHLGDRAVMLAAATGVGVLLWWRGRHERLLARCGRAVAAVVSVGGAGLLNEAIKGAFLRPRPPSPFPSPSGYAFPSAHAAMALAFYGLCAWLVLRSRLPQRWKTIAATGCVLLILLVGVSRVFLSVHWLSDVLGGYATGAAWLTLCVTALRLTEGEPGWLGR